MISCYFSVEEITATCKRTVGIVVQPFTHGFVTGIPAVVVHLSVEKIRVIVSLLFIILIINDFFQLPVFKIIFSYAFLLILFIGDLTLLFSRTVIANPEAGVLTVDHFPFGLLCFSIGKITDKIK